MVAAALNPADLLALFEQSPHPYMVIAAEPPFTIVAANDAYLAAVGRTREELVGRPLFEAFPDNPVGHGESVHPIMRASLQRVLATKRPEALPMQQYGLRRPDGTLEARYWTPHNAPIVSADGSVRCIIHHVEDATAFVRLREERARQDAAGRAMAEREAERAQSDRARDAATSRIGEARDRAEALATERAALLAETGRLADDRARLLAETQRKAAELEAVLSSIPDAIYVGDATGIKRANRPALEMLGYDTMEELNRNLATLAAEMQTRAYDTGRPIAVDELAFIRALSGETSTIDVLARHLKTGEDLVVRSSAAPIVVEGQVQGAVAINIDITAQVRREEELQKLAAIVEHSLDFIATATPDGRMLYINPVGRALVGLAEAEEIRHLRVVDFFPEHEARVVLDQVWPTVKQDGAWIGEQQMRHFRTGRLFTVHRSVFFIRDHRTGEPLALATVTRDITEVKRREEEARRRLEVEQFLVGVVSHDLRSPIAAILLMNEVLLRRPDLDPTVRTAVLSSTRSAERATRLIQDLLDFTQLRQGDALPVSRAPHDFHRVVQAVVDEVRITAPSRQIVLEQSGSGDGEWDADRIAQVVTNLVRNALSYGDHGSPVRVTVGSDGQTVVLAVHNQGAPIPSDKLPLIFEPMQRATRANTGERNIGLGLYIVSAIVKAHGGTIDVASSEDQGTTFTIRLPRHAAP